MSGRFSGLAGLVVAVAREASEREVTFLAASVAYYAFVSVPPLLLLAFAVGTAVGGEALADAVVGATEQYLSPAGQGLLTDAVSSAAGGTTAGLIGLVTLLWSGLRLFRALDLAFSVVYGTQASTSLPGRVRDALVVLVAVGLAALVVVLGGGAVEVLLSDLPLGRALTAVVMVPLLAMFFLPMYVVFPDDPTVDVWRALPGAVLAAVGWTALTAGFGIYTEQVSGFSVYGVLGAALLAGVFLYFAGIVIILGAVANAVLAGRSDDPEAETDREEAEEQPSGPAPDVTELQRDLHALEAELDAKTVSKADLEDDLQAYVRRRLRRGKARGWGPYLVLLYGTAMTLGAFYFLRGGWSILAMVVVWLSTLGLYVLMLLVGVGFNAIGAPGRVLDWVRSRRS